MVIGKIILFAFVILTKSFIMLLFSSEMIRGVVSVGSWNQWIFETHEMEPSDFEEKRGVDV